MIAHVSHCPPARYQKAHYHGPALFSRSGRRRLRHHVAKDWALKRTRKDGGRGGGAEERGKFYVRRGRFQQLNTSTNPARHIERATAENPSTGLQIAASSTKTDDDFLKKGARG